MSDHLLLLQIDPDLDPAFSSRIQLSLGRWRVEHRELFDDDDAALFDERAHRVRLVLVSGRSGSFRGPRGDDPIVIHCEPGAFERDPAAFPLSPDDLDAPTRRWAAFVQRLAQRLGRPGLPEYERLPADAPAAEVEAWARRFPEDPLAVDALTRDLAGRLEHGLMLERNRRSGAERRVDVLEAELATLRTDLERIEIEAEAARVERMKALEALEAARRAEAAARTGFTAAAARIDALERDHETLARALEESRHPLSALPEDAPFRDVILAARAAALAAEYAAREAGDNARAFPSQLAWPQTGATYSGPTRNGAPDGAGVLTFSAAAPEAGAYRGGFTGGVRAGHGVGVSPEGHVWRGEWREGEACGLGVFDAADGRRFEGRLKPGRGGAPVVETGWLWPSSGGRGERRSGGDHPADLSVPEPTPPPGAPSAAPAALEAPAGGSPPLGLPAPEARGD